MHVREILIDLLRSVVGQRVSGDDVNWPAALAELEKARALAAERIEFDGGLTASVVTAANLLLDCAQDVLHPTEIQPALATLDVSKGWDTGLGVHLLRKGLDVVLQNDTALGFSVIAWKNFTTYYADTLGYLGDDRSLEQLWSDLRHGIRRIPIGEIHLSDMTGKNNSWVTEDAGGAKLTTTDPTTDLYDELGLNWPPAAGGSGKTRAVLFCCPLHIRQRAARSLHCPTSVDGWEQPFFVPRKPKDFPWPDHGSAAARPSADAPTLPEAIHGPAIASRDSVDIIPLDGEIDVGDRIAQFGEQAMQRAIARLRQAVAP